MKTLKHREGFTMVELLVALAVFSVVMAMVSGLFMHMLRAQRILGAVIETGSNTSLMFERMTREIRLGYNFIPSSVPCGESLPGFSAGIAFRRFRGNSTAVVVYEWDEEAGTFTRTENMQESDSLAPADVTAQRACFHVSQGDSANNPWRVTILGNFAPKNLNVEKREANLETTISSRILPSDITAPTDCPDGWLARFTNWTSCPQ